MPLGLGNFPNCLLQCRGRAKAGSFYSLKLYKMKIRKKELARLMTHIHDSYAGDYASVSYDLNKAIYCLHFLEKDEIPRDEVQDLCFALHKLSECFYRAHSGRRIRSHQKLTKLLDELNPPEHYQR